MLIIRSFGHSKSALHGAKQSPHGENLLYLRKATIETIACPTHFGNQSTFIHSRMSADNMESPSVSLSTTDAASIEDMIPDYDSAVEYTITGA